eukprot:scaffold969_cov122-Skeletonema_dohrnii-CCMP3373.AAC.1
MRVCVKSDGKRLVLPGGAPPKEGNLRTAKFHAETRRLHFPSFFTPTFLINSSKFQRIDRMSAEVRMEWLLPMSHYGFATSSFNSFLALYILLILLPVKFDHTSTKGRQTPQKQSEESTILVVTTTTT